MTGVAKLFFYLQNMCHYVLRSSLRRRPGLLLVAALLRALAVDARARRRQPAGLLGLIFIVARIAPHDALPALILALPAAFAHDLLVAPLELAALRPPER